MATFSVIGSLVLAATAAVHAEAEPVTATYFGPSNPDVNSWVRVDADGEVVVLLCRQKSPYTNDRECRWVHKHYGTLMVYRHPGESALVIGGKNPVLLVWVVGRKDPLVFSGTARWRPAPTTE